MMRKKIPYTSPILWLTDADSHETLFSVLGAGHFLGLWHLKMGRWMGGALESSTAIDSNHVGLIKTQLK